MWREGEGKRNKAGITLWVFGTLARRAVCARIWQKPCRRTERLAKSLQELGTIEDGSKDGITASWKE